MWPLKLPNTLPLTIEPEVPPSAEKITSRPVIDECWFCSRELSITELMPGYIGAINRPISANSKRASGALVQPISGASDIAGQGQGQHQQHERSHSQHADRHDRKPVQAAHQHPGRQASGRQAAGKDAAHLYAHGTAPRACATRNSRPTTAAS